VPLPRTPEEAVALLASLAPAGVRMGLERIHEALRAIKNPERAYPALHVAGTNGKGSTCVFAATCLATQGYKVGLYTSPHLVRVNERIRINGVEISDALLGQRILEVVALYPQAALSPPPLTYFELGTLVALWHFAQERVDVAVLETGLGGRLDATTAARPAVTAITPISFDHMDTLGYSLAAIAQEKAGIFKPGVPAVVARQPPQVLQVLEQRAREVGAPLRLEERDFRFEPEPGEGAKTYTYRGMRTSVPKLWPGLRGAHQVQNAAVALACLELLEDRGLKISQENARAGLAATEWPGRLEDLGGSPTVLLDGAHNPGGVGALVAALDELYAGRAVHLVFGVLGDKDYREMMRRLFPRVASVDATPVRSPRSLDPVKYAEEGRSYCPQMEVHASVAEALAAARRRAGPKDLILCAGSLFLIGEVRESMARP
jgi:dihydrofolate synthase/folylpolyglutamate synthase